MDYMTYIQKMARINGKPKTSKSGKNGFDIHHIIPVWRFPLKRSDPEANKQENMVYLRRDEHVKAHMLLAQESDAYNDWHSLRSVMTMKGVSKHATALAEIAMKRRGYWVMSEPRRARARQREYESFDWVI